MVRTWLWSNMIWQNENWKVSHVLVLNPTEVERESWFLLCGSATEPNLLNSKEMAREKLGCTYTTHHIADVYLLIFNIICNSYGFKPPWICNAAASHVLIPIRNTFMIISIFMHHFRDDIQWNWTQGRTITWCHPYVSWNWPLID